MDARGIAWDEDIELEAGGGDQLPPDDVRTGGGGSGGGGRRRGGRVRAVWPWIGAVVLLLAAERVVVLSVIELGEAWIWPFAGLGAIGAAVVIGVGGWTFGRLR